MDLDLLNDIDSSPQESRREFPNAKSGSPDVILKTIHIRREQRFELHPGSQPFWFGKSLSGESQRSRTFSRVEPASSRVSKHSGKAGDIVPDKAIQP